MMSYSLQHKWLQEPNYLTLDGNLGHKPDYATIEKWIEITNKNWTYLTQEFEADNSTSEIFLYKRGEEYLGFDSEEGLVPGNRDEAFYGNEEDWEELISKEEAEKWGYLKTIL